MLRASGLASDTEIDLSLIADRSDDLSRHHGEVPHAELLVRFVDAAALRHPDLEGVRAELVHATDVATMIDTAATLASFEMMTRIADGTGTMHPTARLERDFAEVRHALDLDSYQSARTADRS